MPKEAASSSLMLSPPLLGVSQIPFSAMRMFSDHCIPMDVTLCSGSKGIMLRVQANQMRSEKPGWLPVHLLLFPFCSAYQIRSLAHHRASLPQLTHLQLTSDPWLTSRCRFLCTGSFPKTFSRFYSSKSFSITAM